eukprot:8386971-Karenia_brevis.AAC.1
MIDAAPIVPDGDLPEQPEGLPMTGGSAGPRRFYIRRDVELEKFGGADGCPGCDAWRAGLPPKNHNAACRERIENR